MVEITKYVFGSLDVMRNDIRNTKNALNICRCNINRHSTAIIMLAVLGILTTRDIANNRKEIYALKNEIKNMKEQLDEKEKMKG